MRYAPRGEERLGFATPASSWTLIGNICIRQGSHQLNPDSTSKVTQS
jgi:hypothetical protein